MTPEKLAEILAKHKLWLNDEEGGVKADLSGANLRKANLSGADLSGANLSGADLSGANLSGANLSGADLSGANLSGANLSGADLSGANLSWANLSWADLSGADLSGANLSWANLSWADLSGADLSWANLSGADLRGANLRKANLSGADLSWANLSGADLRKADLSGAKELLSAVNFIDANFERVTDGYIAYKTFNSEYAAPESWTIAEGSVITENVNFNRCDSCGCGINVAPLDWVKSRYGRRGGAIWKVLIRWEWLCGVCVPYNSDGKIRCERVELLGVVDG